MSNFFDPLSPRDLRVKYNPTLDVEFVCRKDAILFRKGLQWESKLECEFVHINKVQIQSWSPVNGISTFGIELEIYAEDRSTSKIFSFQAFNFLNNFGILIKALNTYIKSKNNIELLNADNFVSYCQPDLSNLLDSISELKYDRKSSTISRPGKDDWEWSWIEISNFETKYLHLIISKVLGIKYESDEDFLKISDNNYEINEERLKFLILYNFQDHFIQDHYLSHLLTK